MLTTHANSCILALVLGQVHKIMIVMMMIIMRIKIIFHGPRGAVNQSRTFRL